MQKQKKDEDVESILNLFSEQKSLKRPQFGKATIMHHINSTSFDLSYIIKPSLHFLLSFPALYYCKILFCM